MISSFGFCLSLGFAFDNAGLLGFGSSACVSLISGVATTSLEASAFAYSTFFEAGMPLVAFFEGT